MDSGIGDPGLYAEAALKKPRERRQIPLRRF